jgi:hypothetical protein
LPADALGIGCSRWSAGCTRRAGAATASATAAIDERRAAGKTTAAAIGDDVDAGCPSDLRIAAARSRAAGSVGCSTGPARRTRRYRDGKRRSKILDERLQFGIASAAPASAAALDRCIRLASSAATTATRANGLDIDAGCSSWRAPCATRTNVFLHIDRWPSRAGRARFPGAASSSGGSRCARHPVKTISPCATGRPACTPSQAANADEISRSCSVDQRERGAADRVMRRRLEHQPIARDQNRGDIADGRREREYGLARSSNEFLIGCIRARASGTSNTLQSIYAIRSGGSSGSCPSRTTCLPSLPRPTRAACGSSDPGLPLQPIYAIRSGWPGGTCAAGAAGATRPACLAGLPCASRLASLACCSCAASCASATRSARNSRHAIDAIGPRSACAPRTSSVASRASLTSTTRAASSARLPCRASASCRSGSACLACCPSRAVKASDSIRACRARSSGGTG